MLYNWTLNFPNGLTLSATSTSIDVSAWFLYWSNGYVAIFGHDFFKQLKSVTYLGSN